MSHLGKWCERTLTRVKEEPQGWGSDLSDSNRFYITANDVIVWGRVYWVTLTRCCVLNHPETRANSTQRCQPLQHQAGQRRSSCRLNLQQGCGAHILHRLNLHVNLPWIFHEAIPPAVPFDPLAVSNHWSTINETFINNRSILKAPKPNKSIRDGCHFCHCCRSLLLLI